MNRKSPRQISTLAALLGVMFAASAWSDQVVNGGFETGTFSSWTANDPSGFTNVGNDSAFANSGTFHANLGAKGLLGTLTQNIVTTAGQSYTLTFWLANDSGVPPNEFDVFWNGSSVLALSNAPSFDYTQYTFTVAASGTSTPLQFQYRNDDDFFRLDDVSVNIVPEPRAIWLLLPGAAALLVMRRLSRKRQA